MIGKLSLSITFFRKLKYIQENKNKILLKNIFDIYDNPRVEKDFLLI